MNCKNCQSKEIKSRINYPHGKKSRSLTTLFCKACGSTDIDKGRVDYRKRRR